MIKSLQGKWDLTSREGKRMERWEREGEVRGQREEEEGGERKGIKHKLPKISF